MVALIERQHVMLLPQDVQLSTEHLFLSLPHPRTQLPALYLPCSATDGASKGGILEVQRIKPDSDKSRSYFVDQQVVSDGSLAILTPFDPLFLVINLLSRLPTRYMSETELWEAAAQLSFGENHDEDAFSSDIMRFGGLECVRLRLAAVCETQVHEGDTLYRLSSNLVLQVLHPKIDTLTNPTDGIFGPLESTSLGEVLPTPPITAAPTEDDDAASDTTAVATEAPLKIADKRFPTVSRGLGREGVGDGLGLSETIQLETRTKAAVGILSNYLPPSTAELLLGAYSFAALEAQIAATSTSSALSSDYLPGRSNSSEGSGGSKGGAAAAAAKKKQLAKKGSRGVEMLKKASTQGMKPLSSFFTKAPTPAKRKSEA